MTEIKYPGVFIEEISRGPRPIEGVPTSMTAFVGRAWRGPLDEPVHLRSFADYERQFGGLWHESTVSFAIKQFFENGGTDALVVRVARQNGESAAKSATIQLQDGEIFRAANPGSWGLNLKVTIDRDGLNDDKLFNLAVTDDPQSRQELAQRGGSGQTESFKAVSVDPASPQFAGTVLQQSQVLRLESGLRAVAPREQTALAVELSGTDGAGIGTADVTSPENRAVQTGLYALDKIDLFNLLCVPPFAPGVDLDVANDWAPAAQYCRERRAFLIINAPASWTIESAVQGVGAFRALAQRDGALYFPRLLAPDPFNAGKLAAYAPCGAVAGVMSHTDASVGVWKAPAGTALRGVNGSSIQVDGGALSRLPPEINCLRDFPDRGLQIWGAHTLDDAGSEWRYVNVRRFFLYIEESIDRGAQWVVFEPNSEPTWLAFVRSVETFLSQLWRASALVGTKANQAFFVKCDRTTMTEGDIQNGRLVAIIGLAIARPAEFVILKFSQKTAEASRKRD